MNEGQTKETKQAPPDPGKAQKISLFPTLQMLEDGQEESDPMDDLPEEYRQKYDEAWEKLYYTIAEIIEKKKKGEAAPNLYESEGWKILKSLTYLVQELTHQLGVFGPALIEYVNRSKELQKYIDKEIKKKKYGGKTIDQLMDEVTYLEDGDLDPACLYAQLIAAAEAARDAAGEGTALAPLGSIPNGSSLNWLLRVMSAGKGGRTVTTSAKNRHEEITVLEKDGKVRFTRKNKQNGSVIIVEVDQADKYLNKNKTFSKVLIFVLRKMTAQNFPLKVGFELQELVDLGMYSTTSNAARAVRNFFSQQKRTALYGVIKRGTKIISEAGGLLFYHYDINKKGYVTISVNENFNMEFIADYFTIFPNFAFSLSINAFNLVSYIFFLARQNTRSIKEKGTFTINLESVRDRLGLPPVDEVRNRKYRQYIINPIEEAIEEIEESLQNVPEAKEYNFTITPHTIDNGSIKKWLDGYLEIGLAGDFAETFIKIATKAEKDRKQWEKVKQAELARIAARKETKEAQKQGKNAPKKERKKNIK